MFKIWAKIIDDDRKLVKDYLYVSYDKFNINDFDNYMVDICEALDISVPAILIHHKKNYHNFSYVKFLPRDFLEPVDFHSMTIESGI